MEGSVADESAHVVGSAPVVAGGGVYYWVVGSGLVVAMRWIKIDLDRVDLRRRRAKVGRIAMLLRVTAERLGVTWGAATVSRTAHGLHVRVAAESSMTPVEAIAIQSLCGSDAIREILNLARVREGWPHPNVLFSSREKWAKGQRGRDVAGERPDAELTRILQRRMKP